ncbi:MAG: hypothetical protein KC464_16720, partial [Myxococcales bacterium]|nr:hypothetical protein [Myxococcales bacterium]
MRLIELRRHLLLALGIPATLGCGGSAPPEGGTRMYVAGAGSGTGAGNDAVTGDGTGPVGDGVVRNVVAAAPVGQCGGDQLRETVCGAVSADARSCGPMGDSLTSYGNSQLYVTQGQFSSHDATFAGFALDDDATARYRVEIHDFQASLPVEEYCCYTACTTLTVAASAPLDVPAGHHVESRCFPAPPGGTSQPAATNPACPAAVVLDGALRPHDGGTGASCCYQLIVADPPIQQVHHNRGRPARIDGVAHVAGIDRTTTWRVADAVVAAPRDATPTTGDLRISIDAVPAATRARLAGAWT